MDYNIIISTAYREPLYIHETIKGLNKQVHLVVDGYDDYLDEYKKDERFIWHLQTKEEKEQRIKLSNKQRAASNYCRCLRIDDKPALILEDDVKLYEGWEENLEKTINSISEDLYLLSVLHNWEWQIHFQRRQKE
jgi:hypothetical protein